ncbi:MAG: putative transposase [Frankiales bacterium]|nr:putative transposase [Frankiales bacterium]
MLVGEVLSRYLLIGRQVQGKRIQWARHRYLARVLGESAVVAGRTDSFLGERYRRIAKRRGKKRAIVAVGRSILVIVWHLLSDEQAVFNDLGADHFTRHVNSETKKRNHIRQLEALGYNVTLSPAA